MITITYGLGDLLATNFVNISHSLLVGLMMSVAQIVKDETGWELLCEYESYNYLKMLDYDEAKKNELS